LKNIKILTSNTIKDTKENLEAYEYIISENVKIIESDTGKYKIADGLHIYSELDYVDDITNNIIDEKINIAIENLIDAAPAELDTLNEIAAKLNDNDSVVSEIISSLTSHTSSINSLTSITDDIPSSISEAISNSIQDDLEGFDVTDKSLSAKQGFELYQRIIENYKGSVKLESELISDQTDYAIKGNIFLIEDCDLSNIGTAGIAIFNGTSFDIMSFGGSTSDTTFPEPINDNNNYFRKRSTESSAGEWVQFTLVDGNIQHINIKSGVSTDSSFASYVPKLGEFCIVLDKVDEDNNNFLIIGDGVKTTSLLSTIRSKPLGFTPEDITKKGANDGYCPLDQYGIVPLVNLPSVFTNVYTKTEIDNKILESTTLIQSDYNSKITTEQTARSSMDTQISNNIATHTDDSVIHVTQIEKDTWNDKLDAVNLTDYDNHIQDDELHVTATDKSRWNDNITIFFKNTLLELQNVSIDDLVIGSLGYVRTSSQGVSPITADRYVWYGESEGWNKDVSSATVLDINWSTLLNKPASSVIAIDNAVTLSHNHINKLYLTKISEDNNGHLTYNGKAIGSNTMFLLDDSLLPNVGEAEVLYICHKDSRINNYSSISVWDDEASGYNILGRGVNDAPVQVGDMSILQLERFGVLPNTEYIIDVTPQSDFCFIGVTVLKMIPGVPNQNYVYDNFTDPSKYSSSLLTKINNGLKFTDFDKPLELDTVSDTYLYSLDVDINNFTNIESIS
jgi:hypothetical protein